MVVHFEIVDELLGLQVPHEERARPLRLVAAHEDPAVVRDEQRVEEAVLAHLERGHAIAVLQADQVHVHPVARQRHLPSGQSDAERASRFTIAFHLPRASPRAARTAAASGSSSLQ